MVPLPNLSLTGGGSSASAAATFGDNIQNNGTNLLFPSVAVIIIALIWALKRHKK